MVALRGYESRGRVSERLYSLYNISACLHALSQATGGYGRLNHELPHGRARAEVHPSPPVSQTLLCGTPSVYRTASLLEANEEIAVETPWEP
jgi:hypothetical protein